MADFITILRHSTLKLAKTWAADGTIKPYDDPKFFKLRRRGVADLTELSAALTELEPDSNACVVRGDYIGDEEAAKVTPEYQRGMVRRIQAVFRDTPHHWVLIDVDRFEPLTADPVLDPELAIEEYIHSRLPGVFHGASFHWQLSSSAGKEGAEGALKAHVWFWLSSPVTSGQLKAWAVSTGAEVDKALFQTNQVHYTAAPIFERGVKDPVPRRSGFYGGLLGDEVDLDLSNIDVSAAQPTRHQRMRSAAHADPIAQCLDELGLIKSMGADGRLNIECPFADEHSDGGSGASSTTYFPAHTGGYARGHFKCLHDHCAARSRGDFLARIGHDEIAAEFDDMTTGMTPAERDGEAPAVESEAKRKTIPEAAHLTTHQANAGRLTTHFGKRLMVAAGRWYAWAGTHWAADEADVYRCACLLSKIVLKEAEEWEARKAATEEEKDANDKVAKSLRVWAKKSEMKQDIEAAVGLARKMLVVPEEMLDRDPYALNCLNGTVDLRTGVLRPHNPGDYITRVAHVAYDAAAQCPVFEKVLARITLEEQAGGTKPLAAFLRRWFGYCATGSTREQMFVVHYGAGSNGKSTILDAIGDVLGGYAGTAAPGLLVSAGKDRHPTEIADLFGRRMVTAHESGEGGFLREDFVKQATGGDRMKARFMRGDFFEFDPTHKLQLLTNHKPIIKGQDHGIWRRVVLVPYAAKFGTPDEVAAGRAHYTKDPRIADLLAGERAGILRWIVAGAVEWYRDGANPPDVVLAASKDYQVSQDRVLQFINETCEMGQGYEEPLMSEDGGVFIEYQGWCRDAGFNALSKTRFLQEVERIVPFFGKVVRKLASFDGKRRDVVFLQGVKLCREG